MGTTDTLCVYGHVSISRLVQACHTFVAPDKMLFQSKIVDVLKF